MGSPQPENWFHYLLYPDGTPYSAEEILAIRNFKFRLTAVMGGTQRFWRLRDGKIVEQPSEESIKF